MIKPESAIERMIFNSRWILAPFFLGLVVAIFSLMIKFGKELFFLVVNLLDSTNAQVIVSVLTLIDATLIACLLLIIIFSGYENFVSKIDLAENEDRPSWMGKVGFSDLKLKLIGALVAITGVELLKALINVDSISQDAMYWKVVVHVVFVISGVLFAVTDFIVARKGPGH